MLESVKISRRQSEIRQALASLVAKPEPSEDESKSMETMDAEYRTNEVRYRASLIAEDAEREKAKGELETRSENEFGKLVDKFELRQVVLALDEGHKLDGATAEVVSELRSNGGYRGIPVPWLALERRAGETIAVGVPDPIDTRPLIDRLFPDSVAARMGASLVNVDSGMVEYPITIQGTTVGWQSTETGSVASPQAFETVDRELSPDFTLGCQMKITRRALKQSGAALEAAVTRDMNSAMGQELDRVVFLGAGTSGEPSGIFTLAATSPTDISTAAINAQATWANFRTAVVAFMVANAAGGPGAVKALIRPEVWAAMDGEDDADLLVTEWQKLLQNIPLENIVMSANALDDPSSSPLKTNALLTTNAGGVPPIFAASWGSIDLIRDPYSDASSGGLRLTALATLDVNYSRGEQLQVLTGIEVS